MSYIILEYAKFKEKHNLSGIALLVDDKICLVLPKKFKKQLKYSIPKGHIEDGYTPFHNAYLELKEETGIDIGLRGYDNQFRIGYSKNNTKKILTVFVIKMTLDEFKELKRGKRDKKEIVDVKFVSKKKALKIVEPHFKKLIRYIFK